MSLNLVTGYAGKPHIQSSDQGSFNASIISEGQVVMDRGKKLAITAISNTLVRIEDGDILINGRHARLEYGTYEDLNVAAGTTGYNRYDLIVAHYEKNAETGIETVELKVIKGTAVTSSQTPSVPAYTSGNILEGDIIVEMPLYRIEISGISIGVITPMFSIIPTMEKFQSEYASKIETAYKDVEEIVTLLDDYVTTLGGGEGELKWQKETRDSRPYSNYKGYYYQSIARKNPPSIIKTNYPLFFLVPDNNMGYYNSIIPSEQSLEFNKIVALETIYTYKEGSDTELEMVEYVFYANMIPEVSMRIGIKGV